MSSDVTGEVPPQETESRQEPGISPATKRIGRTVLRLVIAAVVLAAALMLLGVVGLTLPALGAKLSLLVGSPLGNSSQDSGPADGSYLYAQNCASCHGLQGSRIPVAPLDSRQFIERLGPTLDHSVSEGKGAMPAWGRELGGPLTPRQVQAVSNYLRSGLGAPSQASLQGKDLYVKNCASCHGEKGNRLPGLPLHSKEYLESLGQAKLVDAIAQGSGIMLAFGEEKGGPLGPPQVQAIAQYLVSAATPTGPVETATARPARK